MIVKELDDCIAPADAFTRAGRAAEQQMAHYLRRAFGADEMTDVINGLRLERDGDAAQIDHLVLHSFGLILIESKSVTTRVHVNGRGEWARWFEGSWRGMPSPILQAERQAAFLRAYLRQHDVIARGKLMALLGGSTKMPIDILVAISDGGIIERPAGFAEGAVLKADQVTDRVRDIIARYSEADRKAQSLFHLYPTDAPFGFLKWEYPRLVAFLPAHHRPLTTGAPHPEARTQIPAAPPGPPVAASDGSPRRPACRHCHSNRLYVEYGRYGYYFRCDDCGRNTPINPPCAMCGMKGKLRKSGQQFYAECASCGRTALYYTNPRRALRRA